MIQTIEIIVIQKDYCNASNNSEKVSEKIQTSTNLASTYPKYWTMV